jgi:hypothetical protein
VTVPDFVKKNLDLADQETARIETVMKGLRESGEPEDGTAMLDMKRKLKANKAWRTRFARKHGVEGV